MNAHDHQKNNVVHSYQASSHISREEKDAIRIRRQKAGLLPDQADPEPRTFGLALSGGGIRSATFCLGLIRRLASNAVLRKFDYLSTVSGGGFIGGALGRLFRPGENVEQGLQKPNSLFLWWLRSNGRYLTPAGMVDVWLVFSTMLRGFLETQFEVLTIVVFLCFVVVLPHALIPFSILWHHPEFFTGQASIWWMLSRLPSIWWLASIVPFFLGIACVAAILVLQR